MCEQTEVHYLEGDVVWVKLGACWWPGKVRDVDKLPNEVIESFRKKPIAAVQFFNEDKYEYVKNLDQICRYNCRRKNDFIKKGLDMYRSKQREGSTFMEKFPEDVSKAEELTGGNPDIIRDHTFAPEEKPNYRNIFGGEKKAEKKPKLGTKSPSSPPWKSKMQTVADSPKSPSSSVRRTITHARIIRVLKGEEEDHDVRIRQQPAIPQREPSPQNDPYKCYKCDFTSKRLNVIIMHSKSHSAEGTTNGEEVKHIRSKSTASPGSPRGRGRPKKANSDGNVSSPKGRVKVQNTNSTESPPNSTPGKAAVLETIASEDTPKDTVPSPEKRSPKTPIFGKRKTPKSNEKTTKKKKTSEDLKEKLLAEWGDEDPEEEEKEIQILKQELSKGESRTSPVRESVDELNETTMPSKPSPSSNTKPKEISCFDFDEKADSLLDHELEERAKKFAEARKFPRIMDEKIDTEKKCENLEVVEAKPKPETVVAAIKSEPEKEQIPEENKDFSAEFENIMAETEMPALPAVPDLKVKDELEVSAGEHDYSSPRQPAPPAVTAPEPPREEPPQMSLEEMDLDINSMPVVMGDTLITEDSTAKSVVCTVASLNSATVPLPRTVAAPVEKSSPVTTQFVTMTAPPPLVAVSAGSNDEVSPEVSIARPAPVSAAAASTAPSKTVKHVVKSVKLQPSTSGTAVNTLRTSDAPLVSQKGGTQANRYVVIQHASGKQMIYSAQTGKPVQQCVTVKTMTSQGQTNQSLGKKLLIVKSPQGGAVSQEIITSAIQQGLGSSKLVPQRIITSQGTILKQMGARSPKVMHVTPQQMKALAGKQMGGAKLTMQSTQTKVVLPTVQKMVTQQQGVKNVSSAGSAKSKANTILIQTTQGSPIGGTIVSRGLAATSSGQPKLTAVPQTVVRQVAPARPKLVQTAAPAAGTTVQRMVVSSAGRGTLQTVQTVQGQKVITTRPTLQPRMLVQKGRGSTPVRVPNVGAIAGVQQQQVKKVLPRAPILQKTKQQPQLMQKVLTVQQPTVKAAPMEASQTITLPNVQSLEPEAATTWQLTSTPAQASTPLLTQEHIAQIAPSGAEQLAEASPTTYVLVTIDEQGALQPYDSSGLMAYDSSGQPTEANTRTLYIDPSSLGASGELENIFLAINNSAAGGTAGTLLNLGQAVPTVAGANISAAQQSSSVFNITDSQPAAPSGSQDILAAALANTDVFQQEGPISDSLTVVNSSQSASGPVMTSRLLESAPLLAASTTSLHQTSVLLPALSSMAMPAANTAGVLETSLTLKPIMTPLEVPSAVTNLQQPPPPIPTSLELPLTITQPVLSMPSTTSPYASISHQASLQAQEPEALESPIASSSSSQASLLSTKPTLQPSMPLLSEDVSDSQNCQIATESSVGENMENISVSSYNTAQRTVGHEQEACVVSETSTTVVPTYAQVPEVSSRIADDHEVGHDFAMNDQSLTPAYQDAPESTSEASASDTPSASEHTVSTSYVCKDSYPKDRSDIGSSDPPQSDPSTAGYSSIESTSEAVAMKEPIPYEQVESTSQMQEMLGSVLPEVTQEPPSESTVLQSYSQAPESTSNVSGSFALSSYSQTPESTVELQEGKEPMGSLTSGTYSQVPESTSHMVEAAAPSDSPMDMLDSSQHSLDSNVLTPYQVPESSSEASIVSYEESHITPSSNQTGYASSSQVPESTSHMQEVLTFSDSSTEVTDCSGPLAQSMPILVDSGTRAVKRHLEAEGTDSTNDMDHPKRVKIDDAER